METGGECGKSAISGRFWYSDRRHHVRRSGWLATQWSSNPKPPSRHTFPKDAKEFNVTCHYCIVGCGYKAYTWPINKQGGMAADENKFGVELN